jgi:hypothetical protein
MCPKGDITRACLQSLDKLQKRRVAERHLTAESNGGRCNSVGIGGWVVRGLNPGMGESFGTRPLMYLGPTQPSVLGPTHPSALGTTQPHVLSPTQPLVLGPTQPSILGPTQPPVLGPTQPPFPGPPTHLYSGPPSLL